MDFDLNAFRTRAKGLLETATRKTDEVAEAVAAKCTEWTGRETTAGEVKKAAVVAGAVAASVGVVMAAAAAQEGAGLPVTAGGGGDWQGDAIRLFAQNGGSLNFETPHIDSEGQTYL